MLEKSLRADNIIKDTEKKLINSIKIANEFKNIIEDKEREIKILKERSDEIRNENYEYQKKLNESFDVFKDSNEIYEKRIRELEDIVICL